VVVKTQNYPTDLNDSQWNIIQPLIPPVKLGGQPRELEMRQVVNAILYLVVSGIQWRMLPKEYPKWQSVYYYFCCWRDGGTWQRIHDTLRAEVRQQAGAISTQRQVASTVKASSVPLSQGSAGMIKPSRQPRPVGTRNGMC
jgi:transposase